MPNSYASVPLRFYSLNAGYSDEYDSQYYDFFELEKQGEEPLPLAPLKIYYTNSAGNRSGEITFSQEAQLTDSRLVLGFSKSPQYEDFSGTPYVYYFGSAGLASSAGMLELYYDGAKIDELCWGKITCANSIQKFATKSEENLSAIRTPDGFDFIKYYPSIRPDAIYIPPAPPSDCEQLRFSEILSFYADSPDEQFIELYNPSDASIDLNLCTFVYKKKSYSLAGTISPRGYYLHRGLQITKNPSTATEIAIGDQSGQILTSFKYPHGQRKGTSYALFDDDN